MPIKPRTEKPTLLQFSDYLEDLHERQKRWKKRGFYFKRWKEKEYFDDDVCKTGACAIGWGLIEKQLPGMRFYRGLPVYDGAETCDAVASYFKIEYEEAVTLFTNDHGSWESFEKVTALDVSKAIKKFLKERD